MALSERHGDFVVYGSLRTRRPEFPLQPVLAVVELRHHRNHALEVDPHELSRRIAQLEHHADGRLLASRLIERRRVAVILAVKLECGRHRALSRRNGLRQAGSELIHARIQIVLQHDGSLGYGEELRRRSAQPRLPQVAGYDRVIERTQRRLRRETGKRLRHSRA